MNSSEPKEPQAEDGHKYLLLWSGGCDSTLLLLRYLKEGKKIRTLAVNHDQVSSAPYEKKARREIKKKLRERGFKFRHQEISIRGRERGVQGGNGGLSQPGIWLFAAIGNLNDKETLLTAYIREDDIWHYRQWYVDAFQNLLVIAGKTSELQFPMEWDTKPEIIAELKKEKLLSLTWYCEAPTKSGRRCGRCGSCKRMRRNN